MAAEKGILQLVTLINYSLFTENRPFFVFEGGVVL